MIRQIDPKRANPDANEMHLSAPGIEDVRNFWESRPCENDRSQSRDRLKHFMEIEKIRYSKAPYILRVGNFTAYAGKKVLEIGCGLGTDGVQFAKSGASYTGVDLTKASVLLARENFALRGLQGIFYQVNAESLPFADQAFDHVYTFGVIHHTPRPEAIVAEIYRILKPGGTTTVMLYNRSSINYYLEIMFLRKISRKLLKPGWAPSLLASLLGLDLKKLVGHRNMLLSNPNPTPEQWISMNTDGPDCPLSRVYSASEAARLFARFINFRTGVYLFDRSHWGPIGSMLSGRLVEKIGSLWGWNRMVFASKPAKSD